MNDRPPVKAVPARADLCRFIAACYYEPCAAFAEERMFDSMLEAASRVDADLAAHARRLGEMFVEQDLQALLVDYTRLFLGPARPLAAPYGSIWLTGDPALMQESTVAVLDLYRKVGFDIDEDLRDLPDHVAVEMEFLYLLIFAECQASGGKAAAGSARDLKHRFLTQHLAAWIGPFTRAVEAGAACGFYRELAALTRRFVQMEAGP